MAESMTGLPARLNNASLAKWVAQQANVSADEARIIVEHYAANWATDTRDNRDALADYLRRSIDAFNADLSKYRKAAGWLHAVGAYDGPNDAQHLLPQGSNSSSFMGALGGYQRQHGLEPTNHLDDATWKNIVDSTNYVASQQPSNSGGPSTNAFGQPTGGTNQQGSGAGQGGAGHPTDPAGIRAVQQQLKDSGHDPGPIDGIWGPRTQAAYDAANGGGSAPVAATSTGGTSAGALSPEDIAFYAKKAGFSGQGLTNIVAIAMAESGGNVGATGDGGKSYGLFQIHSPDHPNYDTGRLASDPLYAATAAYQISNGGTDFSAWTTWSHATASGAANPAQSNLARASQAVNAVNGGYTPTNPVTGVTGSTDVLPPNATAEQIQSYVEKHYPQAAPFFANDEIRSILTDAARNHLDDTEVEARLRQTNYWQTHGPESRAFDAMIARNDGSAGELVDNTKRTVTNALAQQGIVVDDTRAGDIAKAAIRAGWVSTTGQIANQSRFNEFSANLLRQRSQFYRVQADTLVRNMDGSVVKVADSPFATKNDDGTYLVDANTQVVDPTGNKVNLANAPGVTAEHVALPGGAASAQADSYMAQAKRYGVPMSRAAAEDWALRALQGTATNDTFMGWLTQQAKGRWAGDPNVTAAIDSGIDPTTYFDAARTHIANTLELNPDTIDVLNDPKYMGVTQMVDPQTGQRRSMTLGEVDQWARSQPEFANTTAYRQTNADIATKLGSFLGTAA